MQPLTKEEFNKIRDILLSTCGIILNDDQDYLVKTRLSELGNSLNAKSFTELYDFIITDQNRFIPILIDLMTTKETFWFRDDSFWNAMQSRIIPEFKQRLEEGTSKVKVWSAACSTGQESYSLAILIDEIGKKTNRPDFWKNIDILGTDISGYALETALRGTYDNFSIKRGLAEERKKNYFMEENGSWKIREEIKQRVAFKHFNLLKAFNTAEKYDLILLRNVAIYFTSDFKIELLNKIASVLKPNGYLFLGATESLHGVPSKFTPVEIEKSIAYRLN